MAGDTWSSQVVHLLALVSRHREVGIEACRHSVLVRVSVAVMKYDPKQHGEEMVYFMHSSIK